MNIKYNNEGLVPVITQDYVSGEVLILSYMNAEALDKTIQENKLYYYSRSRERLWLKGETSGNTQTLKSLYYDCDQDALLAKVIQVGAACHTGAKSCFHQSIFECEATQPIIQKLIQTIDDRIKCPNAGSYTNYLLSEGKDKILKKIGEETSEVIIASKNNSKKELVYELSDLIYHVLVLMAFDGVSLESILEELELRHS